MEAATMATLILGGVASAAGYGFWGTLLLEGIGYYIDSQIADELYAPDPVEAPRFGGTRVQATAEGAPANRLYGKSCRVAGVVVWMQEPRVVQGGGQFTTFAHAAIELARTKRGPVIAVPRVWANGRLLHDIDRDPTGTSSKIRAEYLRRYPGDNALWFFSNPDAGGIDLSEFETRRLCTVSGFTDGSHVLASALEVNIATQLQPYAERESKITVNSTGGAGMLYSGDQLNFAGDSTDYFVARVGSQNLGKYYVNANEVFTVHIVPPTQKANIVNTAITITPRASANNTSWFVGSVGRYANGMTYMECPIVFHNVDVDAAFASIESMFAGCGKAEGDTVTITQERAAIPGVGVVRAHLGSDDQEADKVIIEKDQARVGVGSVQAFPNRVILILEDFELTRFGGSLANIDAEITIGTNDSVADMISEYMVEDAGIPEGEFDVSAVPSTRIVEGWVTSGVQPRDKALAPLTLASHIIPVDRAGVVTFLDRANLTTVTIPSADLGARAKGDDGSTPFEHSRKDSIDSVDRVWIHFDDPDQQYEPGSVPAAMPRRIQSERSIRLAGITMDRTQATQLAETALDVSQLSAGRVAFSLPPSYLTKIDTGYVAILGTHFGREWSVLVDTVEFGANGLILCEGEEYDEAPFTQTKVGAVSGAI